MLRVDVKPELLRWARERADASVEDLRHRFPKLEAWERGEAKPTLKQLEAYGRATFTPFGFFFLPAPLDEPVPIPDLRTVQNARIGHPSPNLLDTIYLCQQRQDWYREYALGTGDEPLAFVGSARLSDPIEATAEAMRRVLGFAVESRRECPTWTEALRLFQQRADETGVLVMSSGIVANNTRRKLDPDEFRGFALVDPVTPLVFVNGADSKAAQMFTLAHELAHVWLGRSALSDAEASNVPTDEVEKWCNRVAAEMLVPLSDLRAEMRAGEGLSAVLPRMARHFKVSTLVILSRLRDAGRLDRDAFHEAYEAELARVRAISPREGGDFYRTQMSRVSKRFSRALIGSTLEGNTLYLDALRMLGIKKIDTFHELGRNLGYAV